MTEDNNNKKLSIENYLKFKDTEKYIESLVMSRPIPHYASSRHKVENKTSFGLERVGSFLSEIGNPHQFNKYVHITGTSGKTSTTYFVSNLLMHQGYKTGMYISPHMTSLLERFMINQEFPFVSEFVKLVQSTKSIVDSEYENKNFGVISYFEYVLSLALKYFKSKSTDYVALEVGLGGRYDATNIIERSEVSIITNIGLDHTNVLGNTKEEIAMDKAGIIKENCPVLTMEQKPEILNIFKEEAKKLNTSVQVFGNEFKTDNFRKGEDNKILFDYYSDKNVFKDLKCNLCGDWQIKNLSLALRTLELISEKNNKKIDTQGLHNAITSTKIPGRYELVSKEPKILLDGAHNPDKMAVLVHHLKQFYNAGDVVFICGFTAGKRPNEMIKQMLQVSNTFYLTRVFAEYREDEDPLYLKSLIDYQDPSTQTTIKLDAFDALDLAIDRFKGSNKIICVTGSLYLVSYIRKRWYPEYQSLSE